MSWTRADDGWGQKLEQRLEGFADRWHYWQMIQHCSRNALWSGRLRLIDARRCSDHPEPDSALDALLSAGMIERGVDYVIIKNFELDHAPPAHMRDKKSVRERKQRSRGHNSGDHSKCKPGSGDSPANCEQSSRENFPSRVTRDVTRDTRTGQDRTGLDNGNVTEPVEWPTPSVPGSSSESTAPPPRPAEPNGGELRRAHAGVDNVSVGAPSEDERSVRGHSAEWPWSEPYPVDDSDF